jgi:AraC-like DNA-binding protein
MSAAWHRALSHFRLPFNGVVPMTADLDSAAARRIQKNNDALRLLLSYADLIQNTYLPETAEVRQLAAKHIQDLLMLALDAAHDTADVVRGRGVRAARLSAIKADIAANIGEPELTVSAVAARHGVSPRYVQMLFEAERVTFSQYVLHLRLDCAHRMLTAPHYEGWTITAIALEAGFGDLSTFNHSFRRLYGASPSDVRAAARHGEQR